MRRLGGDTLSSSVVLAGYTITLKPGYPICTNNMQTWRYIVDFAIPDTPPSPAISNLAFELCSDPLHIVLSFSPDRDVEVSNNPQPCLIDIGVGRQIKWDNLDNDIVRGEYEFTLQGCFESEQILVAIKAGAAGPDQGCNFARITGPGCEFRPPSRGIRLWEI